MGDITVLFVEAAAERMFNADEVTSIVDLAKLSASSVRLSVFSLRNEAYYSQIDALETGPDQ